LFRQAAQQVPAASISGELATRSAEKARASFRDRIGEDVTTILPRADPMVKTKFIIADEKAATIGLEFM
jgi:hypothetical protein